MSYRRLLAIVCTFLAPFEAVLAGAWTQQAGEGYYKVEQRVVFADEFYGSDGGKIAIPTLGDSTTSFYGEYGFTDRITGVAYVPAYQRITLNEVRSKQTGASLAGGDSIGSPADLELGVRVGLLTGRPVVLSVGLLLGVPTGDDEQKSGLLTGDGEFNQIVSLQVGRGFSRAPLYLTSEVGVNNRTAGYSDELRYAGEFGGTIRERVTLSFRIRGVESLENGGGALGGVAGLSANDQEYVAYGPVAHWRIRGKLGITAYAEGVGQARNVLAAPAYALGLYWKGR